MFCGCGQGRQCPLGQTKPCLHVEIADMIIIDAVYLEYNISVYIIISLIAISLNILIECLLV